MDQPLHGKAFVSLIGKHVMDMSLADFLFVTLPKACVQQIGMVFHENRANRWVA
jgi:hypothetical protein